MAIALRIAVQYRLVWFQGDMLTKLSGVGKEVIDEGGGRKWGKTEARNRSALCAAVAFDVYEDAAWGASITSASTITMGTLITDSITLAGEALATVLSNKQPTINSSGSLTASTLDVSDITLGGNNLTLKLNGKQDVIDDTTDFTANIITCERLNIGTLDVLDSFAQAIADVRDSVLSADQYMFRACAANNATLGAPAQLINIDNAIPLAYTDFCFPNFNSVASNTYTIPKRGYWQFSVIISCVPAMQPATYWSFKLMKDDVRIQYSQAGSSGGFVTSVFCEENSVLLLRDHSFSAYVHKVILLILKAD
jgi:hypothetical protein